MSRLDNTVSHSQLCATKSGKCGKCGKQKGHQSQSVKERKMTRAPIAAPSSGPDLKGASSELETTSWPTWLNFCAREPVFRVRGRGFSKCSVIVSERKVLSVFQYFLGFVRIIDAMISASGVHFDRLICGVIQCTNTRCRRLQHRRQLAEPPMTTRNLWCFEKNQFGWNMCGIQSSPRRPGGQKNSRTLC